MLTRILNRRSLVLAAILNIMVGTASANPVGPTTPTPHGHEHEHKQLPAKLRGVVNYSRGHHAWKSYCYFPRYRCYGYYSAVNQAWFYWYEPFGRFLPISYLATYPPVNIGIAPAANVPASTVALPPDATQVPPQAPDARPTPAGPKMPVAPPSEN